jgi:hypothetical protein
MAIIIDTTNEQALKSGTSAEERARVEASAVAASGGGLVPDRLRPKQQPATPPAALQEKQS